MAGELERAVEAILLVAAEPVPSEQLAQVLEVSVGRVEELCSELSTRYQVDDHGFLLVKVAGGWRYQSHPELAGYVERFVLNGHTGRLSAAALETLAIVAYRQPISRAQIAAVRGVNVDGVVRTLLQRGYIREVDRDPGPGNAVLYGTTPLFLEHLGLAGIDQLPPLAQFAPEAGAAEELESTLLPATDPGEGEPRA